MVYKTPYKPRAPQKAALRKMEGREAFALLMAMRTGKTKVALDDFGRMEEAGEVFDHLVIAPAGVYRTWKTAMHEHLSEELKDRMWLHTWSSGMGKGERSNLDDFLRSNDPAVPRTLLMNVEGFSRAGEARDVAREFLSQRANVTTIDESTIIKNNSKRTKFIHQFIKPLATYRRILSGLPTPRSPLDIFNQFFFLDEDILGFNNWYAFRAFAAIMRLEYFGGRRVPIVVDFRKEALAEIRKKIDPHSYRVEFRPDYPTTYSIREVSLTKEQEKAYREMRDEATTKLGRLSHVTATVVIAQIMKMHQILCGHVMDEDGNIRLIPEHRTSELLELLEDYVGKAIIWCSYVLDVAKITTALEKEYGKGSVARFYGGNDKTREMEEKLFLNAPACRFMIATPDSGGRGRTWSVADLNIYYSSKDNLEHRDQSEQRVMGVGKKRPVDNIDLVAPNTVDMKILEALRKKINMSSAINGDNYREWLI